MIKLNPATYLILKVMGFCKGVGFLSMFNGHTSNDTDYRGFNEETAAIVYISTLNNSEEAAIYFLVDFCNS